MDEPQRDDDKIEGALDLFKARKEEMDKRFKKLESAGAEAIEGMKKALLKWKERDSQEH